MECGLISGLVYQILIIFASILIAVNGTVELVEHIKTQWNMQTRIKTHIKDRSNKAALKTILWNVQQHTGLKKYPNGVFKLLR